ncbi:MULTISPECIES: tlde1 domain-containing protein [unclassified Nitrobacter]|uniref:tlde1 domain-containing protein n=1 Tax=unclassified Nitrobacter TaxID=2620411 RepID=UPI000927F717|nr:MULTISPECIES: tlde1 domain-containing protein [unclassified Nitrobacter]MBN9148866.1 DUF2778 domain-containing protein [Nitrobacter sp.]OJV04190.1 MAG: hypothetical protein BGO16_00540 [Nitrobacter sp. 62-23]
MTYVTGTRYYDAADYAAAPPRKAVPQNIVGAAALGCIALACAWTLYANVSGGDAELVTASLPPAASIRAIPADRIAAAYEALHETPAPRAAQAAPEVRATADARIEDPAARSRTAWLYGPRFLGGEPESFRPQAAPVQPPVEVASLPAEAMPETLPLPPAPQVVAVVPMPAPRPAELRQLQVSTPSRNDVAQANTAAALEPEAEPKKPSIFEKLFGKSLSGGLQLAFAAPDGGVTSDGESLTLGRIPQYDQYTAVYDISARTVYMPNGTKLEAHSGLGKMLDDPRSADRKMRGVTPPHTYDLSLRERPFHGVEAIRLKPVGGEDKIYGRSGLLAHTYMLGPNGDSNGCVSFKNYNAFLRAYKGGQVKRLVVVAKL